MNKVVKGVKGNSKGISLIEVLVAVGVLGMIAVAFLSGLVTAYKAVIIGSERTNAESLARSELEYIRGSPYRTFGFAYEIPATPDDPPPWDPFRTALDAYYAGYSVNVTGVPIDADTHNPLAAGRDQGMQQITIEAYHQDKLVLTTSSYKVNR
jgi:type II secretory pathway pseudopilin PulG